MRALAGGISEEGRRLRAKERQPLEAVLWHRAGFSVLEMKVWSYVRRSGLAGIAETAGAVGAHRVSVGRAAARLRDAGLLAGDGPQGRQPGTQAFAGKRFVALDPPEHPPKDPSEETP